MTQAYWLDKILYKNRIADGIRRAPGLGIMQFVGSAIKQRYEQLAAGNIKGSREDEKNRDFLSHFLQIQEDNKTLPPW